MANKNLFQSTKSLLPRATARNEAGGPAYRLSVKHALAQLAATGCFQGAFYASAGEQLDTLRTLVAEVDDNTFLAKLALYSRQRALLKDMPAALLVLLSKRDPQLAQRVFDRVVDNGRVLRTLLQMIRSGQFGRNSLSSSLQRAFGRWLNGASVERLLSASIGSDPSLRDVLRLARPTPRDNQRRALFGWLTDKPLDRWAPASESDLPDQVRRLADYRRAQTSAEQVAILADLGVRWDLLADAARGPAVWRTIARQMGPQALRMNLNTLVRHGTFADAAVGAERATHHADGLRDADGAQFADYVAARLADADEIRRSRQFPYQFLAAYLAASTDVPRVVKAALHRAAEMACGNVPQLAGPVVIGVDVSGSMQSPVTGQRGRGATSRMRCVDVAALFAAAILRRNPESVIVPFDDRPHDVRLDPQDTILSLAERLAKFGGGRTNCSLPLAKVNHAMADRRFAGCVLISDMESWIGVGRRDSTAMMTEWQRFVDNQARLARGGAAAKLICIDLQAYGTTQAPDRSDILNIGGFSDAVFQVVAGFLAGDSTRFVSEVEAVEL